MKTLKKVINISLAREADHDARNLGINISQFCEQLLREEIQLRREQQWNAQHADFLTVYNRQMDDEGLALDEWRVY